MIKTESFLAAVLVRTGSVVHAQTYPSLQITLMIPFAVGGSNDIISMPRGERSRSSPEHQSAIIMAVGFPARAVVNVGSSDDRG